LAGLPSDYDHEKATEEFEAAEMQEDFYGAYNQEMTPQAVFRKHFSTLNVDQKAAFQEIAESIVGGDRSKPYCFHLKGFGGCGNCLNSIFQNNFNYCRQNICVQYTHSMVPSRKAVPR
jgi:hypothetical protein